jgi:hypothetical protein
MVPVVVSLTLLKVAVAAANPFASDVALTFAVPSVVVVVELDGLLPQLVPTAITITIVIPRKTVPRRLLVARASVSKHASRTQTSPKIGRLGAGQSIRVGPKTALVVVAVNVTVPVGAAPLLPAGFVEI